MFQLSIYNYQFTMNYQLSIINEKPNAKHFPKWQMANDKWQIEPMEGGI